MIFNFSNIVGGFIKSVPSKQIFRDGFKDRFRDDFTDVCKTGVTEPSQRLDSATSIQEGVRKNYAPSTC